MIIGGWGNGGNGKANYMLAAETICFTRRYLAEALWGPQRGLGCK